MVCFALHVSQNASGGSCLLRGCLFLRSPEWLCARTVSSQYALLAQAIFFTPGSIAPYNSFKYMGFMIIGITLTHFLTYFPMWCVHDPGPILSL